MNFPKYPAYKDSGVAWLGEIPDGWTTPPFFSLFSERNESNKGLREVNLLSLSYGSIVEKDINALDGLLPESFETYQIVYPNDLVFRLTDLQNDRRSLRTALVGTQGIITSAYLAVHSDVMVPDFSAYLLRAYDLSKAFYAMGGGLRQTMKFSDMKRIPVLRPSVEEQTRIARFLDFETSKMDALIAEQQRLIELLKEKRQAVITQAVTKGIDPNVPMKDSGAEWLGQVPVHWTTKRYRYSSVIYRGRFNHRPRNDPSLYGGEFAFIQTGDIARSGKYVQGHQQTLNQRGASVSQRFPAGSLVMAIAANIGDTAILPFEAYAPDSVVGFKPSEGVEIEFLRYSLIAARAELNNASTQSAQANLNIERVGSILGAFPPAREQLAVISYLDGVLDGYANLEAAAGTSITLMHERRSALISAAVTGKVDVRDWHPPAAEASPESISVPIHG